MIEYHYETDFKLAGEAEFSDWLTRLLESENGVLDRLDFVFCSDAYLLEMNQQYLLHDTFTDIITFDYSDGEAVAGDVFISVDRVRENASLFTVCFENELLRVMSHGVLHLLGYGDKTEEESKLMRLKEEEKMKLFHVEQ